jgi:hypothetical protein
MDKIKNAWGESANSAGNNMANKTSAVMMRCLSIESIRHDQSFSDSMHEANQRNH